MTYSLVYTNGRKVRINELVKEQTVLYMRSQILFSHNSDGILQLKTSWLELGLGVLASNTKKGTTGVSKYIVATTRWALCR